MYGSSRKDGILLLHSDHASVHFLGIFIFREVGMKVSWSDLGNIILRLFEYP